MALSSRAVDKAFEVMNELNIEHLHSFTTDFNSLKEDDKKHPREEYNYGIGFKSDDGMENLFFFKKNPTPEFKAKWKELKGKVPNSSFEGPYKENPAYYKFGWF